MRSTAIPPIPFRVIRLAGLIGLAAAAVRCGGDPSGPVEFPTGITVAAGEGQAAVAGTAVATAPQVRVTKTGGAPMKGVAVTFTIKTGAGTVVGGAVTTDANGLASPTGWTLGTQAGPQQLSATVATLPPVVFNATALAGPAASLTVSVGDGQTVTVASQVPIAPAVVARDQYSNPVSGVSVVFSILSGGGSVTGATVASNATGVAQIGSWALGQTPGPNQLQAAATGLAPVTFTATAVVGLPSSVAVIAGDAQTANTRAAVSVAPSAIVRDAGGNTLPGIAVTFAVAIGGGSITGGNAITDAGGIARVGSWVLGPSVGSNSLTATVTGLPQATFTAMATPAPGATLTIVAGNNQSALAGAAVAIAPAVRARDAAGNLVAGVLVTFSVASGGGTVSSGTATTAADGVARAGSWVLGPAAGSNTLTASAPGYSPVTFTASSTTLTASSVAINVGNNQSAVAGTSVAVAPSVVVRAGSLPVAGVTVTFAIVSGNGSITGAVAVTGATGVASLGSWLLGSILGENTLSATVAGLPPVTFTATGVAGTAASVAVNTGDNQSATVGGTVPTPPSVIVRDAGNHPVPGVSLTFAVLSGGGSATGTATVTNSSGIATVGNWQLGPIAGANALRAIVTGLPPVDFTATGVAGTASSITIVAGNNQSATVATAVAVAPKVLVRDATSNPITGLTVGFAVASGGGGVTGQTVTTGVDGTATLGSWTLGGPAGANTLTATVSGVAPATFTATGLAGAAAVIAINGGDGQSAVAGTAVSTAPSVVVHDAHGNVVAGTSVGFAVSTGGGSVTGSSAQSGIDGISTVGSWTLGTTAGGNSLSATVAGLAPVSFTATGTPGTAAGLAISSGDNQTTTIGTTVPTPPSVVVLDANGNAVTGATVTFGVQSGGGSRTGGAALSDVNGIATVGSWTLGLTAGANTLSAIVGAATPVVFTATGIVGTASSLSIVAGNGQSATAGSAVATAPTVIVRDAGNNPVGGITVGFAVTAGGGGVTGPTATTAADGTAAVGLWTLGPTVGTNTLTATAGGLTPATFTATGVVGAPASLAIVAGNEQTAPAGSPVATAPSVVVRDANANPIPGVPVTFAAASGGGSVTGGSPLADVNGVATLGSWILGATAGVNTLSASTGGLPPTIFSATGTPGAAVTMAIAAGNNQSAVVETAVATPPSVVVRDINNNPVAGATVTFTVQTGGGSVAGGTVETGTDGIATAGSWALGSIAGTNTLSASSGAITPVTFTASATAGLPATIVVTTGDNQSATVATAVATAPTVLVRDANGNLAIGAIVSFAVTGGGGSVTPASDITDATGHASPATWTLGSTAGGNTLSATVSNLAPVSFSATGTAGAAATVAIQDGNAQTTTVSTAVPLTPSVLVRDVHGNAVDGASVSFVVASGGGSVGGGAATTDALGIAAAGSWTLGGGAGSNTLTATVSGLPAVTFTATGIAGAAASIAIVAGNNQSTTVVTAVLVAPKVIVRDASNNPIAGLTVGFAVSGGGGSVTGETPLTALDGTATIGSWTIGPTVGANTLTATVGSLTGVTFTATGTAGPAASLAVNAGDNQSAAVATAVAAPVRVIALDAHGNPRSGVAVTFAVASGGGSVTAASMTTGADGIATLGSWTLGVPLGANTLSASATGLSPVTITATGVPGPVTSLTMNGGDGQSGSVMSAVPSPLSVLARDSRGNAVPNAVVTFAVATGGGTLTGDTPTTGVDGIATLGGWTLGPAMGINTLTATVSAVAPVTFTATATAGPAAAIAVNAGNLQSAIFGTAVPIPPSVKVTDLFGNPVTGAGVLFQVMNGGGSITGSTQFSGVDGIATVGSWNVGPTRGNNTLRARLGVLPPVPDVTFTATAVSTPSPYNIEVRFLTPLTPTQEAAVAMAVNRWRDVVRSDVPDVAVNLPGGSCGSAPAMNEIVDDLVIFVALLTVDGPGGSYGHGGPCAVRSTGGLPMVGFISLDLDDVADIESRALFDDLIIHQMGHVLGIGDAWPAFGLVAGLGGDDPRYTGANAILGYRALGSLDSTVPVENTGNAEIKDRHWREVEFRTELMSGILSSEDNWLSVVTIGSLLDLGYDADLGAADPYSLIAGLRANGSRRGEIRIIETPMPPPVVVPDGGRR